MRHPHWHSRNSSDAKQFAALRRDMRKGKVIASLTHDVHGFTWDIKPIGPKRGIRATYFISNTQAKIIAKRIAL